jgi:hypothetical protein
MDVPNLPTYDEGHEDPLFGAITELAAHAMRQGSPMQGALVHKMVSNLD